MEIFAIFMHLLAARNYRISFRAFWCHYCAISRKNYYPWKFILIRYSPGVILEGPGYAIFNIRTLVRTYLAFGLEQWRTSREISLYLFSRNRKIMHESVGLITNGVWWGWWWDRRRWRCSTTHRGWWEGWKILIMIWRRLKNFSTHIVYRLDVVKEFSLLLLMMVNLASSSYEVDGGRPGSGGSNCGMAMIHPSRSVKPLRECRLWLLYHDYP